MKREYDVFLSHNHKNKPWVTEFFEFLKSQGLSVFFDEESIEYGENIVTAIGYGIESSRRIILIITPDSLASPWVALESSTAIYSDPDSRQKKILPVILEEVKESEIGYSIRLLKKANLLEPGMREKTVRKIASQLGIDNADEIEIPRSLIDHDYFINRQLYKHKLESIMERGGAWKLDTVQKVVSDYRMNLGFEQKDIKDIELEILGTTLETRISTIKSFTQSTSNHESIDDPISEKVEKAMEELRKRLEKAKGKTFTFLLVGKSGAGKSSTINSLMEADVAPTNDFDPCTTTVDIHETKLNGATVRVIDTPGLCDDLEEVGNDSEYIDLIRQKITFPIDVVLYVTRLDESRVGASERRGLRVVTEAFGESFWEKAVIVFTRSDKVSQLRFEEYLRERTKRIRMALSRFGLTDKVLQELPSVAVDNTDIEKINPDGQKWIKNFYLVVLDRAEDTSKYTLILSTSHVLEKRGISPLEVVGKIAGKTAAVGATAAQSAYIGSILAHLLGVGATTTGTVVGATGSVVLTGTFLFSNPIGWAVVIGSAAAGGGLAYNFVRQWK